MYKVFTIKNRLVHIWREGTRVIGVCANVTAIVWNLGSVWNSVKESYVCQASYTSKTVFNGIKTQSVNKRLTVKNVILNIQEQTAC